MLQTALEDSFGFRRSSFFIEMSLVYDKSSRMNTFFFLSPVAEPNLYDITVHAETVGHVADLLGARLGTRHEQRL